jgi:hypothetical protein
MLRQQPETIVDVSHNANGGIEAAAFAMYNQMSSNWASARDERQ